MKARQSSNVMLVPIIGKALPANNEAAIQTKSKDLKSFPSDHTHQLAFDNSLLANIISVVADGKIIAVNHAAAKLLGYSKKTLLGMNMEDIFASFENDFKLMQKQRSRSGHAIENVTAITKDGKQLPCQVTSVEFTGDNHIKKAISTLVDRSEGIRKQKSLDFKREKKADAEMVLAQFKSDALLNKLVDLEHKLDSEISAKEQLQSSSQVQEILGQRIKG